MEGRRAVNGNERQKEQSARMIEEGLDALMEEKPFDRITVSEIVRKADVARRTFYRLYRGKEDVLRRRFERLCGEYRARYPVLSGYDLEQIAGEYFGFWHQNKAFLLLLYRSGMEGLIYFEISRASVNVIRSRMGAGQPEGSDSVYFAEYSTGGFLQLLMGWIREGMEEAPEEYAGKISRALRRYIT